MDTTNTSTTGDAENAAAASDSDRTLNRVAESSFSFELYDSLVEICQNNVRHFESLTSDSITNQSFLDAFRSILQHIEIIRQYITEFNGFAHEYDFDEQTPGNGYRSIVKVTHAYIKHTAKVSKHIAENRGNLLFRKKTYAKYVFRLQRDFFQIFQTKIANLVSIPKINLSLIWFSSFFTEKSNHAAKHWWVYVESSMRRKKSKRNASMLR